MSNSIINGLSLLNSLSTKPGEGQMVYHLPKHREAYWDAGAMQNKEPCRAWVVKKLKCKATRLEFKQATEVA